MAAARGTNVVAALRKATPRVHHRSGSQSSHNIVTSGGSVRLFTSASSPRGAPPSNTPSSSSSSSPSSSSSQNQSSPSSASSSASSSKPPQTAYEKQRRREWVIIGLSSAVATAGGYYWYQKRKSESLSSSASADTAAASYSTSAALRPPTSFAIAARGPGGERIAKVITMLTPQQVDRKLRQNEQSTNVEAERGTTCLVSRYDTNSVGSNDPIEDRRAEAIVERDQAIGEAPNAAKTVSYKPKGDLAFFTVMDGHSGFHTSTYLSQKLIAFVALELEKVFRQTGEYAKMAETKAAMPSRLWQMLAGGSAASATTGGLDGDSEIVKRAISKAFVGLDKEIVNTPLELLKEYELSLSGGTSASSESGTKSLSSLAHSIFPTPGSSKGQLPLTATHRTAYESMLPALSGSCALLTYIDSARKDVFVACTGDSRAIGGWLNPADGKWTIEPLSVDQTGRNQSEVKRMRSEHPASEQETVIMRGRVLGGLEPTRAFGDARYKWSRDVQQRLYAAFLPDGGETARGPPRLLQSPPYVTARPEIEWRRLPSAQNGSKQLKFIVMATDGLWDMLSNEEVGSLVAGYLGDVKGNMTASELETRFLSTLPAQSSSFASTLGAAVQSAVGGASASSSSGQAQGQQPQQQSTSSTPRPNQSHHPLHKPPSPSFSFQDSNLATHLIRNALGGAERDRVGALLAIPAPDARRYRDDITVNVILLNDVGSSASGEEVGTQMQTQTGPEPRAKL